MMIRSIVLYMFIGLISIAALAQDSELTLEEHINTPAISSRRHPEVVARANHIVAKLRKSGFRTSTLRNGEVVMATLPCDTLFAANSITPKREAVKRLQPLSGIVEQSDRYKMLVAVHADDSGDDAYSDMLTEARANAIDDILWQLAGHDEDTNVVIYGLGADEPIHTNDTRRNRRENRRVEFYIVPLP